MAEISAKEFLDVVKKSGLVDATNLKNSLAELSKIAAGQPVRTPQLAQHLLDAGLITRWQQEKLIAGKYKGYFLAQYKLLDHLGSGGMSSVYLAEHVLSGHRRAIKVLPKHRVADKSYLDRFYLEGRAAAALNHPHIVRIYDLANVEDTHFMVMEFVEGVDLQALVRQEGPLAYERALDYIQQAAMGLEHAHGRNLVHRDIKPANLLLNREQQIKILDLGLALLRDDEQSLTLLHNETVMGTADYLSPEQAVNSHSVDHRADFYSLGGTLYFLLSGHPPFPKGTIAQRIAMHQTQSPQPIAVERPDCPPIVQQLIDRLMSKRPEQRFENAKELIRTIKRLRHAIAVPNGETHVTNVNPSPQTTGATEEVATTAAATGSQSPQSISPVAGEIAANATVTTNTNAIPKVTVPKNLSLTPAASSLDGASQMANLETSPASVLVPAERRKRVKKSYTMLYVLIGVMFVVLIGILVAVLVWLPQ